MQRLDGYVKLGLTHELKVLYEYVTTGSLASIVNFNEAH